MLTIALAVFFFPLPLSMQLILASSALLLVAPGIVASLGGAPYVVTPRRILERMMDWAQIRRGDIVYDLGCGDGRLVFEAARRGAKATGYELSLPTYALAKGRSIFHKDATIALKNFWKQDYRDADVVFCFLQQHSMARFQQTIWPTLKPGCRVVSHAFPMPGVEADRREGDVVMYRKTSRVPR